MHLSYSPQGRLLPWHSNLFTAIEILFCSIFLAVIELFQYWLEKLRTHLLQMNLSTYVSSSASKTCLLRWLWYCILRMVVYHCCSHLTHQHHNIFCNYFRHNFLARNNKPRDFTPANYPHIFFRNQRCTWKSACRFITVLKQKHARQGFWHCAKYENLPTKDLNRWLGAESCGFL